MHASEMVTCSLLHSSEISCDRGPKQAVVTRNMHAMCYPRMPGLGMLQRAEVIATISPTLTAYARQSNGYLQSVAFLGYLLRQGAKTSSGHTQYARYVLPAHAWLDHAWLQSAEVLARDSLTIKTCAREMVTCSLATIAPSNSAALSGLDIAKRAAVSMLILEVANMRRIDAHCRPVSIQRSR